MVKSLLVGLVSVVPFCDPSGETLYRTGIIDIITTSVRHSGKAGKGKHDKNIFIRKTYGLKFHLKIVYLGNYTHMVNIFFHIIQA